MDLIARLRSAFSLRKNRTQRLRVALFVGVGLAMTGIALVAFGFGLLKGQELGTVDTRFSVRGTQPVPKEVATVLIDDATFDTVNDQWPFPWKLHAKVIRNLVRDGAKVIVYDVQFSELSRYGAADAQALGEAILKAGNVVLSSTATDEKGRP